MRIVLSQVREGGSRYEGEAPATVLELEEDRFLHAGSPVRYDLSAQLVSHQLVVRGRLESQIEATCARCGHIFSTTVSDSSFLRAYELADQADSVDISGDLRDAILLECPHFPLCSPECRGLCSQCGKNLNEGPCECSPPREAGAWDTLDQLKL